MWYIELFWERLSEKVHATIPKGIVGGFEFIVLQRHLREWHERLIDVCLRVLKESDKSCFDSYSVRNSELIVSHITFRDYRVHIFSDNLSRNSCIKAENSSTLYKFREGRKRLRLMGSNANRKNNAFFISWDKMTAAWQRSIRFGKVQHLNRALNCEWPFHMNWYWKCLQCREWCFYDYIIYARMNFFLFL